MAYPNHQPQQYWDPTANNNVHLKLIPYTQTRPANPGASDSYYNTANNYTYNPVAPSPQPHGYPDHELTRIQTADTKIKSRIRLLRLISRSLAVLLSAATLAPLAMTLIKFFQTRNEEMIVDGVSRTAWASGTIAWYTYMYFGISTVSFLLNAAIMISYCRGTKQANTTAQYAGYWSALIMGAHVVVWAISVGVYRYGKEPVDGKFRDLWGWSCSEAANAIQEQVTNVNFEQYCSIQTTSFFTGIANTVAGLLSALIYVYAIVRMRSKKKIQRVHDSAREPLRS
ncbi:hypothetical protein LTR09_009021 [Extremus antarcticus]|uniref:MARVEL domain-containing protein n=1 Tax=Extremus antarcticus TaxID=702011 RepID=A0AAJ0DG89_9PEZI|nr:hypothetical protein LTR09_009021 [Extremus antarcticus]